MKIKLTWFNNAHKVYFALPCLLQLLTQMKVELLDSKFTPTNIYVNLCKDLPFFLDFIGCQGKIKII